MLDATAEALGNHLLTVVPTGHAHPRADLAQLPPPIAHYLGSVLNRRIEEKAAPPESPWLDTDHELVQTARKVWRTAAREGARFPKREWTRAVRTASRQVLNYLVEPAATLVSFVYSDASSELDRSVVQERMAAFSAYPYLREVAEGYVERKGLDGIERDDFEKLLRRIDKRMVAGFGPADWLKLLAPLFDLVSSIPEYENGLPNGLLQQFFQAKGLEGISARLDESESYSREELLKTLSREADDVDPDQPDEVDSTKGAAEVDETVSASEPKDERGAEPEATAGDSPEPIWQRLAREQAATKPLNIPDAGNETVDAVIVGEEVTDVNNEEREAEFAEDEKLEPVDDGNDVAGSDEPLWKRFANVNEDEDSRSLPNSDSTPEIAKSAPRERSEPLQWLETRVLGSTATERRDWYAAQLTGGSEPAYRMLLEELDQAESWSDAWPILKERYKANNVEIYSDAIVAFTDAVEKNMSE